MASPGNPLTMHVSGAGRARQNTSMPTHREDNTPLVPGREHLVPGAAPGQAAATPPGSRAEAAAVLGYASLTYTRACAARRRGCWKKRVRGRGAWQPLATGSAAAHSPPTLGACVCCQHSPAPAALASARSHVPGHCCPSLGGGIAPPPLRPPMLKSACLFVHVCRWAATACAPLCVSPTQLAAMHVPPHLPATPGRPHLCSAGGRPRRWPRPRGESLIARCDTKGWVWRAGRAQGRTAEPPSATLAQALQRRHFGRTSRATGPPPFTSTRRGRRASAAPTQRPRRAGAAVQPGAAGPTPQRCAAPPPGCGWPTS